MNPMPVILSVLLFAGCVIFRHALEADPVTHVLVQLPLLAVSGVLMIRGVAAHSFDMPAPIANALTLVAVFAILFWMLPRYIDAALVSPLIETAKFVSIPMLVGCPLAIAWARSHPFLRGFLKANAISMLGILAFLYIHAPVRICNSYLVADQERLGYGFLIAAFVLGGAWSIRLFFPRTSSACDLRLSSPASSTPSPT